MERKTLSAHELNKYAYCPYQWYYEQVYGRKELRRLYQERQEHPEQKKRVRTEQSLDNRFRRGREFHQESYENLKRKKQSWKKMLLIILLLFVAAAVAGYVWGLYGNGMA